ncbi:MAG TPA: hypothetical protein RMH85_33900 [Polyangiaceae bacterium LLY-WYZ-15_(1-7)]|nr:hypothetical protein [Sandaracinus sp.]HJK90049.1 hypothetical protein [Polyangiaceae bacterium LLY-WYZ-15_(1-7)]MBJ73840.1 hypothetical protein [Sandaracinus sp.]HJL00825.1 hypothetical protein [Polyangiaceae bacterium LLY-WYZ-15_(1-7)]HJL13527.1 hypothetical protein [Polyangiaceae bacterium LLY-WYZ-15_(1-7)]
MKLALVALSFVLLTACSKDDGETRRERRAEPRREETTLELAGIRATVPSGYERLDEAGRERLSAAASRRDPGAEVRVAGAQPAGAPIGLVLTHIVHDPAYGAGYPVSESARDAEDLARVAAEARGIVADTERSCGPRSCDVVMTLQGPALTTSTHLRMWRVDGRLVEVGCQCMTNDALDTCALPCELPEAPGDATLE